MQIRIKRQSMRAAFLFCVAATALAAGARPATCAPARSPTVVELFTAQGCAACVKADAVLGPLADRKGVVALTFPVDIWDYLGWPDSFAQPSFSERERAYANRLKVREIYTPWVVVNGRGEAFGLDEARIKALVKSEADARDPSPGMRLLHDGTRVRVDAWRAFKHRAEVWLVSYDPTEHDVKVKAGENKGKTVPERDVVHDLTRLGSWSGRERTYALPKAASNERRVVLLQETRGGPILAAMRL